MKTTPTINTSFITWTLGGHKAEPIMQDKKETTFFLPATDKTYTVKNDSDLIGWKLDKATETLFQNA